MSWQDITTLYNEGYDIESHTMTHNRLNKLSASSLDFELGQSKQCLLDHLGINATIFAYPFDAGRDNATVINVLAKYYNLARGGESPLMFLHCNGYTNHTSQTDCTTYDEKGMVTFENRYNIRSWAHIAHILSNESYDNSRMFQSFIQEVNSQDNYNKDRKINVIPVISYHNLTQNDVRYTSKVYTANIDLFSAEMKYLHDNRFMVLTMADLGYDENSKSLYVKGIS